MFRVLLIASAAVSLLGSRADADTQLGRQLSDFYRAFGKPSFQEHLGRTSNVRWSPFRAQDATLASANVFAVEASAIDGVVCQVVARSRRSLSDAEAARITQRFFQRRYRVADFAAARKRFPQRTWYRLRDGDYVDAKPHDGRYIVVVSSKTYWQNIDVFDREAAKVRPPTSNH